MNIIVSFATIATPGPVGKTPGNYRYTLSDSAGITVSSHDDAATTFTFASVASGDYLVSAQILDSTGAVIDSFPAISAPISVPSVPVDFPVPQAPLNVVLG